MEVSTAQNKDIFIFILPLTVTDTYYKKNKILCIFQNNTGCGPSLAVKGKAKQKKPLRNANSKNIVSLAV